MLKEIGIDIEDKLGDPEILIQWLEEKNRFAIWRGKDVKNGRDKSFDYFNSIGRFEGYYSAGQLYKRYADFIKDSRYYAEFMAYILGSHV